MGQRRLGGLAGNCHPGFYPPPPPPDRVVKSINTCQVKPICVAHKWTVQKLEEFIPPNAQLLGMNVGRQKIFIRLRPAGDLGR